MNFGHFCITLFILCTGFSVQSQELSGFFAPSDTFNHKRFNAALAATTLTYTGFSIALYNTWYKDYPRSDFHFFNDYGEWNNVDKMGHIFTAYIQNALCYKGAKWTGLSEKKAILTGTICSAVFQSTIEVMDGFSSGWGFSIPDFSANMIGIAGFVVQQKIWREQRIMLKTSSSFKKYSKVPLMAINSSETTTLQERADALFGNSIGEKFLKDYNAQTSWISINLSSFFKDWNAVPKWLNLSLGYGAENMFGGFENSWTNNNGSNFQLNNAQYPRYKQYFLSLDIDFSRLKIKSPILRSIMTVLNIFKLPAPAIEYSSTGEWRFHFVFF